MLAWYHGEQGRQRVSGTELMIIALVLAFGGVLLWFVGRSGTPAAMPATSVAAKPVASTASASSVAHLAVPTATSAAIPAKSIAVLPFENLSSDKNNAYFADGMQDLILTKLAGIGDLAVISRTSTLKYGSHPENLQTVGKQLGVATILEGSVQKVGDQVLVNVQLIDARNDHHIWADSYTRTLKNVFSVEGEVAQKIADTLKAKLSPAEAQRLATTLSGNTAANDLYLQGEYFAHRGDLNLDPTAMKQAIALYRQAAARAPDFAEARARLSMVESELAWYGGGGENTAALFADALSQAEQALKLAPNLADAHLALGMYEYWGKGDYPAALKAISAALALRPNDAGATVAKAFVLRRQGRFRQAIGMLRKAQALDPRDVMIPIELGNTYASIGQYAQAEQAVRHALVLDPASGLARATSAIMIVFRSGDLTKALAQAQGDEPRIQFYRAYLLILGPPIRASTDVAAIHARLEKHIQCRQWRLLRPQGAACRLCVCAPWRTGQGTRVLCQGAAAGPRAIRGAGRQSEHQPGAGVDHRRPGRAWPGPVPGRHGRYGKGAGGCRAKQRPLPHSLPDAALRPAVCAGRPHRQGRAGAVDGPGHPGYRCRVLAGHAVDRPRLGPDQEITRVPGPAEEIRPLPSAA